MPANFPPANGFSVGSTQSPPLSNAGAADRLNDWLGATKRLLGGAPPATYTIVAGNLTPDGSTNHLIVDTENGAATDNLDVINPVNFHDGAIICVRSTDASRVVTLRHGIGSNAFLSMRDNEDVALRTTSTRLFFQLHAARTQWQELFREWGNDGTLARADLGLSTAATYPKASVQEAFDWDRDDRLLTPAMLDPAMSNTDALIMRHTIMQSPEPEATFLCHYNGGPHQMPLATLMRASFTRWTETGELSVSAGSHSAFAHNLGAKPGLVRGVLRCKTAEHGYNVGFELSDGFTGVSYGAGDVNFSYAVSAAPQIANATTGAVATITPANWRLVLYGFA